MEHFSPPWEQPIWRTVAEDWVRASLAQGGLSLSAPIQAIHLRPWSAVFLAPTQHNNFYFKAGAPNQVFEPALLQLLAGLQARHSLPVLAIDPARGWALLPDGGQTLRQSKPDAVERPAWERLLGAYAQMQIDLASHETELLATGLPDRRPVALPGFFEQLVEAKESLLVGQAGGLTQAQYARFARMGATVERLVTELEAFGLPASIEHGDLHDANVFAHGQDFVFFDWGDASLSHPFFSLMIPLRVLGNRLGLEPETHPDLDWARDAYLQPWTRFASQPSLIEAWRIALHLARFQRALTWYGVAAMLAPEERRDIRTAFPAWVLEFLDHDLA